MIRQPAKQHKWIKVDLIAILEKLTGQKSPINQMDKDLDDSIMLDAPLGYSQFNELLLALGYDRVTKPCFDFIFGEAGEIKNPEEMLKKVNEFRIRAMLQFGNVKFAFKKFRDMNKEQIDEEVRQICPRKPSDYSTRHRPLIELKAIPQEKTPYLGYILLSELESKQTVLKQTGQSTDEVDELSREVEQLKNTGRHNLRTYLTYDHLDVYVATSMRERFEFWLVSGFVKELFNSPILEELKLRWFDPTQCFCDNRIDKGIVEGLMLKRSKCTIYLAQESDTLGKDSELAATLAQGKPVIAYVPQLENYQDFKSGLMTIWERLYPDKRLQEIVSDFLPIFYPKGAWENEEIRNWIKTKEESRIENILNVTFQKAKETYDKRANQLKDLHPLGLQVNLQTGVANGVIVARKVMECAQVLRGIMLCDLNFIIEEPTAEDRITRLRESITNSVFRVVTEDELITNSFWNFWRETLKN